MTRQRLLPCASRANLQSRGTNAQGSYSAAMRSQVISRYSSLMPVRRGGSIRIMRFALETHAAHLIAADPALIRCRVNPSDKPRAVVGVVAAIRAVFPAGPGGKFRP